MLLSREWDLNENMNMSTNRIEIKFSSTDRIQSDPNYFHLKINFSRFIGFYMLNLHLWTKFIII